MGRDEYWIECVECALDEAGVSATTEQIKTIAGVVQGSAENIDLAFHQPENPLSSEVSSLHRELERERGSTQCDACSGRGRIVTNAPWGISRSSDTGCWKCGGDGKLYPKRRGVE